MNIANAIIDLYPNVVKVENNEKAYDVNGNEVNYDLSIVTAKAESNLQKIVDIKESALAKLMAIGLTENEIKALIG